MIRIPEVVTSGGTATFVLALTDANNERLSHIRNGTATVSLRKTSTRRTRHELTHLPTTFDPVAATVTLELSSAQTTALSPPVKSTGKQASVEVVGDVRLVQSNKINYYGPFSFRLRLPET